MRTFPKLPYLIALKVEAGGVRDGRPARLVATVSPPDGHRN